VIDKILAFLVKWGHWIAIFFLALHVGQLRLKVEKLEEEQK